MRLAAAWAMGGLRRSKAARNTNRVAALEAAMRTERAYQRRRALDDSPAHPLPAAIDAADAEIAAAEREEYFAGENLRRTEARVVVARGNLDMIRAGTPQAA